MARSWNRKARKAKKPSKKVTRAKEIKKLAFDMGCVERGLKNPNSQISASFNAGKEKKAKQEKKPLY